MTKGSGHTVKTGLIHPEMQGIGGKNFIIIYHFLWKTAYAYTVQGRGKKLISGLKEGVKIQKNICRLPWYFDLDYFNHCSLTPSPSKVLLSVECDWACRSVIVEEAVKMERLLGCRKIAETRLEEGEGDSAGWMIWPALNSLGPAEKAEQKPMSYLVTESGLPKTSEECQWPDDWYPYPPKLFYVRSETERIIKSLTWSPDLPIKYISGNGEELAIYGGNSEHYTQHCLLF